MEYRVPRGDFSRGSILVVDDKEYILDYFKHVLFEEGYDLFLADSGHKALDLYASRKESIDLIILDMDMPLMSGEEVLCKLLSINPSAKVLLSINFLHDIPLSEGVLSKAYGVLPKYHTSSQLIEAVNNSLSR